MRPDEPADIIRIFPVVPQNLINILLHLDRDILPKSPLQDFGSILIILPDPEIEYQSIVLGPTVRITAFDQKAVADCIEVVVARDGRLHKTCRAYADFGCCVDDGNGDGVVGGWDI